MTFRGEQKQVESELRFVERDDDGEDGG